MRRANAPSASASALEPPQRVSAPEPARGLEQRRGLQLAAPQVALDRDVRRVGVLALQQLAFGERRARLRERAQLRRVLVARELGERPREQQVAGRDGDLAPGYRRDRRMAAAQLRAVDQVVVHERRRVHELDRDSRAHEPLLAVGASPAAPRRTPRRAPRAAGAGACRRRRPSRCACAASGSPARAVTRSRWRSVRAIRARSAAPPRAHDRVEPVDAAAVASLVAVLSDARSTRLRARPCPRGSRRSRRP